MKRYVVRDCVEDYILEDTFCYTEKEELEKALYLELGDSMKTYLADYPNEDVEDIEDWEKLEDYVNTTYSLGNLMDFFEYDIEELD